MSVIHFTSLIFLQLFSIPIVTDIFLAIFSLLVIRLAIGLHKEVLQD